MYLGYLNQSNLLYQPTYILTHPSKHRTPNNKHPLLLSPHPLNNLIRCLRKRSAGCRCRRYTIQLKQRRHPRKANIGSRGLMMNL